MCAVDSDYTELWKELLWIRRAAADLQQLQQVAGCGWLVLCVAVHCTVCIMVRVAAQQLVQWPPSQRITRTHTLQPVSRTCSPCSLCLTRSLSL